MTALAVLLAFAPVPAKADAELVKKFGAPVDAGKACKFELAKDVLTVSMPAPHHTLTAEGGSKNAPRTERAAAADFVATVKVKSALPGDETSDLKAVSPGVGGGIVFWIDDKNYAALIRVHEAVGEKRKTTHELHYVFNGEEGGDPGDDYPYSDAAHVVRLTRKGMRLTAEQSADGKTWTKVADLDFSAKPGKVGVFAEHNTLKPVAVTFTEFEVK